VSCFKVLLIAAAAILYIIVQGTIAWLSERTWVAGFPVPSVFAQL